MLLRQKRVFSGMLKLDMLFLSLRVSLNSSFAFFSLFLCSAWHCRDISRLFIRRTVEIDRFQVDLKFSADEDQATLD